MRTISTALQDHIEGEVTTLCQCLEITRNDGVVIRMTEHNADLVVDGNVFRTGATFNMSSVKSSSDLSVDNATMDIGLDEDMLSRSDFDRDLLKRAKVYLFSVNWASPTDGVIPIKRGWIGDVTIRDEPYVTLALRGLTQALQRNILEQYSPTCRAEFGDRRCGVAISPLQRHRRGFVYKTGSWVVVPDVSLITTVPLPNASFEVGGNITESDPIPSWTKGANSKWIVTDTISGEDGSYLLSAGNPVSVLPGFINAISQDMSLTVAGMSPSQIDNGQYVLFADVSFAAPDSSTADECRITLHTFDNQFRTIQTVSSAWERPSFGVFTDLSTTLLVRKGARHYRVTLEARQSSGAIKALFDNVRIGFYDASLAAINSRVYKSVRTPGRVTNDAVVPTNYRFAGNGLVAQGGTINGWTNSFYRVVTNASGLSPYDGAYFALSGDNLTTTPAQIYSLAQVVPLSSRLTAVTLTAGGYLLELNVQRAQLNTSDTSQIQMEFLDSGGGVVSTSVTGYSACSILGEWENLRLSSPVPNTTVSVRVTLMTKSGADSTTATAFGGVYPYLFNTTVAAAADPTNGRSASTRPAFNTILNDFTYDGGVIWQAHVAPFGFDIVNNVTDRRVFDGTVIDGDDYAFYGARITWLSGANAGIESFVRTWLSGTKTLKLYSPLPNPISGGDSFMFSLGCNKTINDCGNRFNNAINFRGEPYLPGQEKALEFFANA